MNMAKIKDTIEKHRHEIVLISTTANMKFYFDRIVLDSFKFDEESETMEYIDASTGNTCIVDTNDINMILIGGEGYDRDSDVMSPI